MSKETSTSPRSALLSFSPILDTGQIQPSKIGTANVCIWKLDTHDISNGYNNIVTLPSRPLYSTLSLSLLLKLGTFGYFASSARKLATD